MRIRRIVFPAIVVLLTALIYGRAVQFPLFMDDAPLFRWLESLSAFQPWTAKQVFSFYRPAPFTLFKLFWNLQGRYDPFTLHIVVTIIYVLNVLLLGLLARRITHQNWTAVIAVTLFIVFPFSYSVVPYVTNLFHIALATGLLGAMLLGLHYLDKSRRWSLIGAWSAAFFGIFSHENGVLAPFLVLLVLAAISYNEGKLKQTWRKLLWIVIPIGVIAIVYGITWRLIPKYPGFGNGILWDGIGDKLAYAAQGGIYPFVALVRPIAMNGSSVGIIALLTITIIGIAMYLMWRAKQFTQPSALISLLAALLWSMLAVIPGILFLPSDYWLGSPRLLYLSSIGIVLFWTIWLAALWQHKRMRIVAYGVVLLFFAVGAVFTVQRVDMYARMGDFYYDLIRLVQRQPDSPSLSVNNPFYIAPKEGKSTFLIGAEGANYLANYVILRDLLWLNTGVNYPIKGVGFLQTLPSTDNEIIFANEPWLGWEELDAELGKVQTVYTLKLSGNTFYPVKVGDKITDTVSKKPLAQFDDIELLDASLDGTVLTLQWQAAEGLYAVPFIHIWCDGKVAAQADGPPLGGMHPFDRWIAGEQWIDYRDIGKPCPTIEAINVGLVDIATGERVKAELADGKISDVVSIPLPQ